jgi:hypothetical protein
MQREVIEFLKENSPQAYTARELMAQIDIGNSISSRLNKLVKLDMVQARQREVVIHYGVHKINEYYYECHRTLDNQTKDLNSSSAIE